jgi:SAM-dependent methyltransferase
VFVEASEWIRDAVAALPLERGAKALDVGSSTQHFRTVEQPHIERNVIGPLRERGVDVTHLDAKHAQGVDVVADLDSAGPDLAGQLGGFELVLCSDMLAHVLEPANAVRTVASLVEPGGWLVLCTPDIWRRTPDPRDTGLRLDPEALAELGSVEGALEPLRAESVRIDEPRYYRGLHSRGSWMRVGDRFWLPLPGGSEAIRKRVRRLRWLESCALFRRPA